MADTPYYQNGQYNPGLDPRPFSALTPAEQAARAGGSINIPADQIKPATPIATVTITPTDVNGSLASAFASLPNPNQAAIDQTKSSINDIVTEFGNQSAYQAQQENAFGVNTDKQAINDLQGQLRALNAESAAKQVGIDNQPILSSIASDQAAQEEKLRAIKALSISGQIEAMQGKLQLALDQVDHAMKLKYDPLKTKLDLLNQQLQDNYDSFNAEEKRRANQLQAENDIKLQQLKDQQAADKELERTIVTALSNGAPLSLVTQARQLIAAGNTDAALASLHAYTGVKSADASNVTTITNESAAVNLYSSMLDDQLSQGRTPEQAVQVATAAASALGTNLSLKEQNALLTYARTHKSNPTTTTQVTTSTQNVDQENKSAIEAAISDIKKRKPNASNLEIRANLQALGYPQDLISQSSARNKLASSGNVLSNVANGIGSFFTGLFK